MYTWPPKRVFRACLEEKAKNSFWAANFEFWKNLLKLFWECLVVKKRFFGPRGCSGTNLDHLECIRTDSRQIWKFMSETFFWAGFCIQMCQRNGFVSQSLVNVTTCPPSLGKVVVWFVGVFWIFNLNELKSYESLFSFTIESCSLMKQIDEFFRFWT